MPNHEPTVALLSPGAMGSAIAARLTAHGIRVLTSLDGRSAASRDRASSAGMIDVPDRELATADIVLSVVPPADAEAIAERLLPLLGASHRNPPYIDANAINPRSKRTLAERFDRAGCTLIDGSIVGPPPGPGTDMTTIYLAGPGAADATWLGDHGLDVQLLTGPVGSASALKMCFAGINKGMIGLAAAMLLAAERSGAGQALQMQMAKSMPELLARFRRQIPDMYPKAYRWVAEMREISGFLDDDPAAALIFEGMAQLYEHIADASLDGYERHMLDAALARRA